MVEKNDSNNTLRKTLSKNHLKGLRVRILSEYNDEVIDGIYYAACGEESRAKSKFSAELASLKNNGSVPSSELSEIELFLSDDCFEAELVRQAAEEMVIIALYKTVEIVIKRMLHSSGIFTEEEVNSFYRTREMKNLVRNRVVNLENLPGFFGYDELRSINNCIKHSGKVSKELANFAGWVKDDKIGDIWSSYQRLKPEVRKFVKHLSEEIIKEM